MEWKISPLYNMLRIKCIYNGGMGMLKMAKIYLISLLIGGALLALIGLTIKNSSTSDNGEIRAIASEEVEPDNETTSAMINVNQFSRITSDQLIEIMGEPEKIEDYSWTVPKTGKSITGKLYIYQDNKYEFIVFDGAVVRLNIYSGTFMGYSDENFSFKNEESLFSMFGIVPSQNLKKINDNNLTLRYSPVSDKVADLWIQNIKDNTFEIAKITYNLNYF